MITLKDIFKAVCEHISEVTETVIVDSDIKEPVTRPCFKIFMSTSKSGFYSSALRELKVYFNLYYYAADKQKNKSEIIDMTDKLSFSFLEPFRIKENCAVYIDDLDFEKVENGILNCSFDFEIGTEFIDESELENMEELFIQKNQ